MANLKASDKSALKNFLSNWWLSLYHLIRDGVVCNISTKLITSLLTLLNAWISDVNDIAPGERSVMDAFGFSKDAVYCTVMKIMTIMIVTTSGNKTGNEKLGNNRLIYIP